MVGRLCKSHSSFYLGKGCFYPFSFNHIIHYFHHHDFYSTCVKPFPRSETYCAKTVEPKCHVPNYILFNVLPYCLYSLLKSTVGRKQLCGQLAEKSRLAHCSSYQLISKPRPIQTD